MLGSKGKTTEIKGTTQKYFIFIQRCFDKRPAEQHTLSIPVTACNNVQLELVVEQITILPRFMVGVALEFLKQFLFFALMGHLYLLNSNIGLDLLFDSSHEQKKR